MSEMRYPHQKLGEVVHALILADDPARIADGFAPLGLLTTGDADLGSLLHDAYARRRWARVLELTRPSAADVAAEPHAGAAGHFKLARRLTPNEKREIADALFWLYEYVSEIRYRSLERR